MPAHVCCSDCHYPRHKSPKADPCAHIWRAGHPAGGDPTAHTRRSWTPARSRLVTALPACLTPARRSRPTRLDRCAAREACRGAVHGVPELSAHLTQRLIGGPRGHGHAAPRSRGPVQAGERRASPADGTATMSTRPTGNCWPAMWGEPDEDRWLTVQVAELHGYLFDLSEPDVLDQTDESSALIPAILAQPHPDGDTVLMLETADWLAPLDSAAAGRRNCEPARPSRVAAVRAAGLRPGRSPASRRGRPSRTAGARTSPALSGWPAAGTLSTTASWSEPATHQQPAPRTVSTPTAAHRSTVGAATGP